MEKTNQCKLVPDDAVVMECDCESRQLLVVVAAIVATVVADAAVSEIRRQQ